MEVEPTPTNVDQPGHEVSPFKVGQLLDGKYEVISLLGRGGMGAVYRVRHTLLKVDLALKTLDTQRLGDASSSRRFQTEAKAAFSLQHPNLVKVHDFGVLEDGHPFLVMDLVQGQTLQSLIKERGQLSFSEIDSIFVQLCFGLAHAHNQQVVHRDIKPANIMIVDGVDLKDEGSIKILDFGIAKIVNEDRGEMDTLTQTGEIFGSPYYMSPEQCSGEAIDQRSDIYSLGCVLFEAITGTPPLVGSNALRTMMLHVNDKAPSLKEAALGSDFPRVFEQIVAKMLAKSPADRYSDLGMVAHEIHKACAGNLDDPRALSGQTQKIAAADPQKNTVSFTPPQFACLLATVAALSIVATLCATYAYRSYLAAKQQPTPKPELVSSPIAPALPGVNEKPSESSLREAERERSRFTNSFKSVSSIAATPVVVNNQKFRQIVFPDASCGSIRFGRFGIQNSKESEKMSAIGIQRVPAARIMVYNINEVRDRNVLFNSFIFDRISPDLFSGLEYESATDFLGLAKVTPEVDKETHEGVMHLFHVASKWTDLNYVNLRNVKNINDVIESLNKIPHLSYLALVDSEFDPVLLAKQPFISRLDKINLTFTGDASAILKSLSGSKNIREITLERFVTVSPESLNSLKNCPKLEMLVCNHRNFSDLAIEAIAGNKWLDKAVFVRDVLTQRQKSEFEKHWRKVPGQEAPLADKCDLYMKRRKTL